MHALAVIFGLYYYSVTCMHALAVIFGLYYYYNSVTCMHMHACPIAVIFGIIV